MITVTKVELEVSREVSVGSMHKSNNSKCTRRANLVSLEYSQT